MKKSNIIKLITFILSAVLLIGAVVGISVAAAENEPTLEIKHKNLSYEGAIKVLYAVDAQNISEDLTLKMYFYNSIPTQDTEYSYAKDMYVDKDTGESTIEINGAEYFVFFSEGVAPKNMRASIYAKAVAVDADGNVKCESEVVEYSIWQYAVNRFSKSPTSEQLALYTAMLDYGAAVQKMLVANKTLTEADVQKNGGYIDEYCGIQLNVSVDGELTEGDVVYYAKDTAVTLDEVVLENGNAFQYFADAKGKEIEGTHGYPTYDTVAATPGKTVYTSVFAHNGATLSTFGEGTTLAANNITPSTNAPEVEKITEIAHGDYTLQVVKEGKSSIVEGTYLHSRHARIVGILDADKNSVDATADGVYTVGMKFNTTTPGGSVNEVKANSGFSLANTTPSSVEQHKAYRHVVQFDLYIGEASGQSQGWFRNPDKQNIWGYNTTTSGDTFTLAIQGDSNKTNCPDHSTVIKSGLARFSWHTIRFEYYDLADDKMAVYVYVDGQFCPSGYGDGSWIHRWNEVKADYVNNYNKNDAYMRSFDVNYLQNGLQMDFYYDNMYLATEYEYVDPTGIYRDDPATLDFDYTEEMAAVNLKVSDIYKSANSAYRKADFLGFNPSGKLGVMPGDGKAYQYFAEEDGNYYIKSGVQNIKDTAVNVTKYLPETTAADVYVVEFDLRYYGFGELNEDGNSAGKKGGINFGWLRFYDCTYTSNMDNHINLSFNINDTGYASKTFTFGPATLNKGEWINIRIEATPKAGTTNQMDYKFIIDNYLVMTGTYTTSGNAATAGATNASFGGIVFQARTFFNYYEYDLDNLYVGVINKQ